MAPRNPWSLIGGGVCLLVCAAATVWLAYTTTMLLVPLAVLLAVVAAVGVVVGIIAAGVRLGIANADRDRLTLPPPARSSGAAESHRP